jgi:thiol:disulfide interchange protein DsbD
MKKIIYLLLFINLNLFAQNKVLFVDDAFRFEATVFNNTLELNWDIAEGYYLYKNKIKISTDFKTKLNQADFPKGKMKEDFTFGKVEIYRGKVWVTTPIVSSETKKFKLQVSYQGCADIGICYPPVKKTVNLTIDNFKKPKTITDKTFDFFSSIGNTPPKTSPKLLSSSRNSNKILSAEQAFILTITKLDDSTLLASWDIQPSYYLYHNKFFLDVKGAEFGDIDFPKGKIKDDDYFGKVQTHRGLLEVKLPLKNIKDKNLELIVNYQGCADAGVCYPPQKTRTKLNLNTSETTPLIPNTTEPKVKAITNKSAVKTENLSEQDSIVAVLESSNFWVILLLFLGFGLLLTFTPCVFPMIPILSRMIIGQGETITTKRAFIMSLTFVLAMAITYAIIGVVAGYYGGNLQIIFQNQWALISFSAIFIILALSMFGLFEIQLPRSFQAKVSQKSAKHSNSGLGGVFIMGFLSTLIVGPCAAPALAGAFIYIGNTGDAALGGMALFSMGIGMGLPLIIIGTTAGKFLPKAGLWMDKVKGVFGLMMLGVAVYLLDRIIPNSVSLILWAILITFSAIYLGALDTLTKNSGLMTRLWKTFNLILLGYAILLWLLVVRGPESGGHMLAPLQGLNFNSSQITNATKKHAKFISIDSSKALDDILNVNPNKLVILDFQADWCISCKELERFVFSKPAVISALEKVIFLKIDVTKNNTNDKEIMRRFNIIGPPAFLFFKQNSEIKNARLVGEFDADFFINHLKQYK